MSVLEKEYDEVIIGSDGNDFLSSGSTQADLSSKRIGHYALQVDTVEAYMIDSYIVDHTLIDYTDNGRNETVTIYDRVSGDVLHQFENINYELVDIAGNYLSVGHRVYDLTSGELLYDFSEYLQRSFLDIDLTEDYIVISDPAFPMRGDADYSLHVFNLETGEIAYKEEGTVSDNRIHRGAILTENGILATAQYNHVNYDYKTTDITLSFTDIETGLSVGSLYYDHGFDDGFMSDNYIVTTMLYSSDSEEIHIYDATSFERIRTLDAPEIIGDSFYPFFDIAFNDDKLLILNNDNDIVYYDITQDKILYHENFGDNFTISVSFDDDVPLILTANGLFSFDTTSFYDPLENVIGGSGDDVIHADYGDNIIDGGTGRDIIYASSGNDTIIDIDSDKDIIDGGHGTDTISFMGKQWGISVNLSKGDADGQSSDIGDVIRNVENVVASQFDDVIIGSNGANEIYGRHGKDQIYGLGGNDTFHDSDHARDIYWGGAGNDTISFAESDAYHVVNLTTGTTNYSDHLDSIENIIASNGGGSYTGDALANIIWGGAGKDVVGLQAGDDMFVDHDGTRDIIWAGAGEDTLSYAGSDMGVDFSFKNQISSFNDYAHGFENFIGTDFDDSVIADANRNIFTGGKGADIFHFETANDSHIWHYDTITDFESGRDMIELGFDVDVADIAIQAQSGFNVVNIESRDFQIRVDNHIALNDIIISIV